MTVLRFYPTVRPRQGGTAQVVSFAATADEIARIARIDRIGRDEEGRLTGFQRPQIAAHVREIRDYLNGEEAILPNAIVLAFGDRADVDGDGGFKVDVSDGPPGWVVDGQQRLSAAAEMEDRNFEFIVAAFVCHDARELNRQFILINNTRPLAKPLIYELLPGVEGLPDRLADRAEAALLTEALNYRANSALKGEVLQQTNPDGSIKDTVLQRVLMNSIQHGALRDIPDDALLTEGYALVNAFFGAVKAVFAKDWIDHTAKTSRLLHGAGLVAMGFVFDELVIRYEATDQATFERRLQPVQHQTHWTGGEWQLGAERRPWNSLQNTAADYRLLAHHLVRLVRRAQLDLEPAG